MAVYKPMLRPPVSQGVRGLTPHSGVPAIQRNDDNPSSCPARFRFRTG